MTVKLSICIPTYNNAHVIRETLDSISSQAGDDVEIVVSDNASSDETRQIIENYKEKKFPRLHYFRWERNMGVDWNLLKVVEISTGEYCWFLGDDLLKPGAIARVMDELRLGHDLYLCNKTCCDHTMRPFADWPWLSKNVGDKAYDFSKRDELLDYLDQSQAIGALFAFLSVDIFRRKLWNNVRYPKKITSTGFAHVYVLLAIVAKGCSLKYIKQSLILQRGGNDSFPLSSHPVRRFLLDLEAYRFFADTLFDDAVIRGRILKIVTREHRWYRLAKVWNLERDPEERKRFESGLASFGAFNPFATFFAKLVGSVPPLVPMLLYLKQRITFRKSAN